MLIFMGSSTAMPMELLDSLTSFIEIKRAPGRQFIPNLESQATENHSSSSLQSPTPWLQSSAPLAAVSESIPRDLRWVMAPAIPWSRDPVLHGVPSPRPSTDVGSQGTLVYRPP